MASVRRPASRLRRVAFAALPTFLLLALLCGLEAVFRVWLPPVDALRVFLRSPQELDNLEDKRQERVFEADPLLFWRLQPDLDQAIWDYTIFSTNAQGLRHPRDVGPKPEGGFRVVALGDSVTFGFRVPVVWADRPEDYDPDWQPYPRLLEAALRREYPGRSIEVVPLAVPGYTSHQGLHWLRREIGWLEPDVVIMCFGWNDVTSRGRPDRQAMPAGRLPTLGRSLVLRSQLLMRLVAWRAARRPAAADGSAPTARVPLPSYLENMAAMVDLARSHSSHPVLVAPIYRDPETASPEAARLEAYRLALRGSAEAAAVTYLRLEELTGAGYPGNQALFGEAVHPNHLGHRVLARALLASLQESGALESLED